MNEQIKKLLEENVEYSKEIYHLSLKVKKYIFWGRIMSMIQLLFILVPLIIGIIYLPPLIGDFFTNFSGTGAAGGAGASTGLNGIFEQYGQLLDIYK